MSAIPAPGCLISFTVALPVGRADCPGPEAGAGAGTDTGRPAASRARVSRSCRIPPQPGSASTHVTGRRAEGRQRRAATAGPGAAECRGVAGALTRFRA